MTKFRKVEDHGFFKRLFWEIYQSITKFNKIKKKTEKRKTLLWSYFSKEIVDIYQK